MRHAGGELDFRFTRRVGKRGNEEGQRVHRVAGGLLELAVQVSLHVEALGGLGTIFLGVVCGCRSCGGGRLAGGFGQPIRCARGQHRGAGHLFSGEGFQIGDAIGLGLDLGKVRALRSPAGALVGFAQGDLAEEPLHVELVRDELTGKLVQQLGVGGRVFLVHHVQRVDQAAAHELEPETVDAGVGEAFVGLRGELLGEQWAAAELGHAGVAVLRGHHLVFLSFGEGGHGDFLAAGQARAADFVGLPEHGLELDPVGGHALGQQGDFGDLVLLQRALGQKRVDAVEAALGEVIDRRVVVALSALEIHAEEEAGDVVGGLLLVELFSVRQKLGGGCDLGVAFEENEIVDERVPRAVGGELGAEPLAPFGFGHFATAAPLQQHHRDGVLHALGKLRAGQQPVDELGALLRVLVRQEGARLGGRRDAAGEVQPGAAQKFSVRGQRGERAARLLGDVAVNFRGKRRRSAGQRKQQQRGQTRQKG